MGMPLLEDVVQSMEQAIQAKEGSLYFMFEAFLRRQCIPCHSQTILTNEFSTQDKCFIIIKLYILFLTLIHLFVTQMLNIDYPGKTLCILKCLVLMILGSDVVKDHYALQVKLLSEDYIPLHESVGLEVTKAIK